MWARPVVEGIPGGCWAQDRLVCRRVSGRPAAAQETFRGQFPAHSRYPKFSCLFMVARRAQSSLQTLPFSLILVAAVTACSARL